MTSHKRDRAADHRTRVVDKVAEKVNAKADKLDRVALKVNADNYRAIRFYERNGFAHDGEDVNPASKRLILKMAWKP